MGKKIRSIVLVVSIRALNLFGKIAERLVRKELEDTIGENASRRVVSIVYETGKPGVSIKVEISK